MCLSLELPSSIFFSGFYSCVRAFVRFVCLLLADFIYHSLSTRSLTSTVRYFYPWMTYLEKTPYCCIYIRYLQISCLHINLVYIKLCLLTIATNHKFECVSSCQHIYMKHKKPTDSDLAEKYNVPVHCRMAPVVAPKLKI